MQDPHEPPRPRRAPQLRLLACGLFLLAACRDARVPTLETGPPRESFQPDGPFAGYTLVPPLRSLTTYLVDMEGEVVHTWPSEYKPGNSAYLKNDGSILRCAQQPDPPVFTGGGQGGRIQQIAWDGTVLWDFLYADEDHLHHHDIEPLPNGNVLLIAWEKKTREEAIAHGRDPALIEADWFWPDYLVEIEPVRPDGGNVVWEWHTWDHLVQDIDPDLPGFGDVAAHPELVDINGDQERKRRSVEEEEAEQRMLVELGYAGDGGEDATAEEAAARAGPARPREARGPRPGPPPGGPPPDGRPPQDGPPPDGAPSQPRKHRDSDWMHTNSVDYHSGLDLIAISVRRFNEVWVIDHSTTTEEAAGHTGGRFGKGGDLLYRWGNPAAHGAGGADDRRFFGQHDVQWIPAGHLGAGNFLLFNNGRGREDGDYSTVDEFRMPMDARGRIAGSPGRAFEPADLVWSYRAETPEDFYSSFISGTQRLPNGNTLIVSGVNGRVFEVTPSGDTVWDWDNPFGGDAPKDDSPTSSVNEHALFRVTRIAPDHPGLSSLAPEER